MNPREQILEKLVEELSELADFLQLDTEFDTDPEEPYFKFKAFFTINRSDIERIAAVFTKLGLDFDYEVYPTKDGVALGIWPVWGANE